MKESQLVKRISYLLRVSPKAVGAFFKVLCSPELKKALDGLNADLRKVPDRNSSPIDLALARKLIANYLAQAHDYELMLQNESKQVYCLSPQWKRQVEETRKDYVEYLRKGDADGLSVILGAFFRNSGSEGITAPTDYGRRATINNAQLVLLVKDWYSKLHDLEKESRLPCKCLLNTSTIGKPYLVRLDGMDLHSGALYYLAHVYEVIRKTELEVDGKYLFVDLGAGYGNIIKFLLTLFPQSKAIIFDIPEILIFSSYYLNRTFDDKRIGYSLDVADLQKAIREYDILFLPHWRITELSAACVDLFVNTGSLPEMPLPAGRHYLRVIKQTVKPGGYFYTYNRWSSINTVWHPVEFGLQDLLASEAIEEEFDTVSKKTFLLLPNSVYLQLVLRKRHGKGDGKGSRYSASHETVVRASS